MFRTITLSILGGIIVTGIAWFFLGRVNTGQLESIAEGVSESYRETKQIGDTITKRYDAIASTITRLDLAGAGLTADSVGFSNEAGRISEKTASIQSGISDFKTTVDRIENRNREIVSIVGELRKVNENFYERTQVDEEKN